MANKTSKNISLIIISIFTLILIILLLFTIARTTGFADEIFKSKTDSKLLDSKATEDLEKLNHKPPELEIDNAIKKKSDIDYKIIPQLEISGINYKNQDKYTNKPIFLISNKNWKNILSLIPITTWTKQSGMDLDCQKGYQTPKEICIYPTLIFNEKELSINQLNIARTTGFDIDSILYFIEQYAPSKIVVVGRISPDINSVLSGLNIRIEQINAIDYFSYWQNYEDVVYVDDPENYELAMLATTYASLINAPLIISGSDLDNHTFYENKNIICVSNNEELNLGTQRCLNKSALEKKYVNLTNTNKIILINSNDLNISVNQIFQSNNSNYPINKLYSETSLVAPILASAKHELIISTQDSNYQIVDLFIKNKITELSPKYGVDYLTIIASPIAIDVSYPTDTISDSYYNQEVDNRFYGNIDEDDFQDLAVGRLFGITISDSSSLLARTLFLDIITNKQVFLSNSIDTSHSISLEFDKLNDSFQKLGYSTIIKKNMSWQQAEIMDYIDKEFIIAIAHGDPTNISTGHGTSYLISNNIWLNTKFALITACNTCNLIYPTTNQDQINDNMASKTFCVNLIRRGAVTVIANTTPDGSETTGKSITESLLIDNLDIGNTLKYFKNKEKILKKLANVQGNTSGTIDNVGLILVGDPTLKFDFNKIKPEINYSLQNSELNIIVPQRKLKNIYESTIYSSKISTKKEFEYPSGSILSMQRSVFTPYFEDENGNTLDINGTPINIETDLNLVDISSMYTGHIFLNKNQRIIGINYIYLIINNNKYLLNNVPFFPSSVWQQNPHLFYYELDSQKDHNEYLFALDERFGDFMQTQIYNDTFTEYRYKIGLDIEETD